MKTISWGVGWIGILSMIAVFFLGSYQVHGLEVDGFPCAELAVVEAKLLQNPEISQYIGQWCAAINLLVKDTGAYQCVQGYKDGDCEQMNEIDHILVGSIANDILVGIDDDIKKKIKAESEPVVQQPVVPPTITSVQAPTNTQIVAPPVIISRPTTTSRASTPLTRTSPTNSVSTETTDLFGVSLVNGVPSYNPNPSDGTIPLYDPGNPENTFVDAETDTLIQDDENVNDSSDTIDNNIQQENYEISNEQSSFFSRLLWLGGGASNNSIKWNVGGSDDSNDDQIGLDDSWSLRYASKAYRNPREWEVTVRGYLPEEYHDKIIDGEMYVYTPTDLNDEVLDQVKEDLVNEYLWDIISIEDIFDGSRIGTKLTNDFVVRYKTGKQTFDDIVQFLDKNDLYVSEAWVNAVPWFVFDVAESQQTQIIWFSFAETFSNLKSTVKGWFWSEEKAVMFGTQSFEGLDQWHLDSVWYNDIGECLEWWRPVKIAVVDNGFDTNHEDLDDAIVAMYDEADKDKNIQVPNYKKEWNHGTKEAGLVGAETDDKWVKWIFPNSELILIKATKDNASGKDITNGIEAIATAYELGADVINLSRWGYGNVPILSKVTKAIASKGVYVVAAAGNFNKEEPFYPAAYEWVIAVAAVDENWEKASFSNYGDWVDIAAPGVDILTTDLNDTYEEFNGTSEASPIVAWALWLAVSYGLDRNDIKDNVASIDDDRLGEWILDVRFVCDLIPDDFSYEWPEHNSSDDSQGGIKKSTLIMIAWWLLILLWLIALLIDRLRKKNNTISA